MGCTTSKEDINDINPNIFKVYNVDDSGNSVNEGQLEIAGMNLILHQRGKDPIHWPLKCLRRYGFDQDLFSFESGRRCPTGPGIYAFRCRQAETLFNVLQDCIHQAGEAAEPSPSPSASPSGLLLNVQGSFTELRTASPMTIRNGYSPTGQGVRTLPSNFSQHQGANGQLRIREHLYMNGNLKRPGSQSSPRLRIGSSGTSSNSQDSRHEYLNASPTSLSVTYTNISPNNTSLDFKFDNNGNDHKILNYAELDLPKSSENLNELGLKESKTPKCNIVDLDGTSANHHDDNEYKSPSATVLRLPVPKNSQPTYINIGAEAKKTEFREKAGLVQRSTKCSPNGSCDQPSYANLELSMISTNGIRKDLHAPAGVRRVNYIQLDLDKDDNLKGMGNVPPSPLSLSVPDSPSRRTESYATIDFNKTTALSNSSRNQCPEDDGVTVRKTRHDSTANDLY